MFHRKQNQTAEYTNVPAGAGVGGTANYPSGQKLGYGFEAGRDVHVKSGHGQGYGQGYGHGYDTTGNVLPQQGAGYVHHQHTPVSYGPTGQPIEAYPKKKNNRVANWCAAAFVACWACTWPCHGPCCCGL